MKYTFQKYRKYFSRGLIVVTGHYFEVFGRQKDSLPSREREGSSIIDERRPREWTRQWQKVRPSRVGGGRDRCSPVDPNRRSRRPPYPWDLQINPLSSLSYLVFAPNRLFYSLHTKESTVARDRVLSLVVTTKVEGSKGRRVEGLYNLGDPVFLRGETRLRGGCIVWDTYERTQGSGRTDGPTKIVERSLRPLLSNMVVSVKPGLCETIR